MMKFKLLMSLIFSAKSGSILALAEDLTLLVRFLHVRPKILYNWNLKIKIKSNTNFLPGHRAL